MLDRNGTIKRLQDSLKVVNGWCCRTDSLDDPIMNVERAMEDALELLKAQEPRVMTLEELDAIYQINEWHIWPFNTPPYLWMTVNPDARWIRGFWICWRDLMYSLENSTAFYVRENYGKVWKIWTAEPTDEQIKVVKWDAM